MALFRKGPSPHQTALAMIGARSGDRVLLAGRPDPALVAEVARITGLSGHALLATTPALRQSYDDAAAEAGVLVETMEMDEPSARLPSIDGAHDIVAVHIDLHGLSAEARSVLVASALDAVRPGGRVVIIEGRRRAGLFAARTPRASDEAVLAALTSAGALAARTLGHEDDVTYFEGRKTR